MNREIKFRVWDKYKKQMYPISSIDYDIFSQEINIIAVGHKNGMCTSYNKNHNSEKCDITALELMQYTGLHDKNGKEIWENDIVEITRECIYEKGIIIFKNGCFFIKSKETLLALYNCELNNYKVKVIENITDNPELLGGE